ncbi:MAG: peptide/nickel transport system permease protein [Sulfurospirillum sp.]|nr:peptide/nickel transport system permease protein [Sulfurospirillum sp.]
MKIPFFSLLCLIAIVFLSFFGLFFYEGLAYELNPQKILLSPSFEHPFGTDRLGRDVLARVMEGGKISLSIGLLSSLVTSFIGLIIGVSAGFFKSYTDKVIVVLIDLFLTFPTFFLLLALVSYVEASIWVLVIVISITGWMGMARLIRSESFAISEAPFIKILKIAKTNRLKIILKYFTPLLAPIFFISFTFGISGAILAESGLSFLGIGINPPQISWGTILSEGKEVLDVAWWLSFFPGLMIFLVTYSLINISDYLQNKTNTKDKQLG